MGKNKHNAGCSSVDNRRSSEILSAILDRMANQPNQKIAAAPCAGERESDLAHVSRLCPPPPETKVRYKLNGEWFELVPAKPRSKKHRRRNRRPKH